MYFSEIVNFNSSQKIILEIENEIKSNFNDIQNAIQEDNQIFCENVNFMQITNSINLIKNENWNFKEDDKNIICTSLGNIAVIYGGTPDVAVYMILKSIKTNNNLVLFESFDNHKSTKIILNIVNRILKQNDLKLIINCKLYDKFEDVVEYKEFFNKYICIGDIEKYKLLKAKVDMPIIYNAYGTLALYLDDKSNEKILREIDDYIFKHNIKLELYKDDLRKVIADINKSGNDFMLLIFSDDKDKTKVLIEKVNVKNIVLNKNPFLKDYNIFIEDGEFLEVKKIMI